MKPPVESPGGRIAGFRTKVLVAMMIVVTGVMLIALYFGQRSLVTNVEEDLQREFQAELAAVRNAREIRHAGLVERCRALVRKPRIQSSLLDDAIDRLYPSAKDELQDLMARAGELPAESSVRGLRAQFYRFLGPDGALIPASNLGEVGVLTATEEARLALPALPEKPQAGYFTRETVEGATILSEIIAMPIVSTETGETIAALVLGFEPFAGVRRDTASGMKSGILVKGKLHSTTLPASLLPALVREVGAHTDAPSRITLGGVPHLLFSERLNPGSLYPPAAEVCVFPLADLVARQTKLRWQVLGAGALLLLVGLGGSHVMSARLSAPVEKLAVASEENRTQRARAEAALEMTSVELQRSARFSADASHQLKTPVTVLRAGLEELMARETHTPEECAEISALIHQTYRLSSLIEDLLLLSRMDAGRLKLKLAPVNLSELIEASLDDLGALPDELAVAVETDFPAGLLIAGEKRFTAIILQNLLENARKYNRPSGRIRIAAVAGGDSVRLVIGNTGHTISAEARAHIFERFHRGAMGENVPGYGLGLNLARELARLHQGDLRLVGSDASWTEFEVRFRPASVLESGAVPA